MKHRPLYLLCTTIAFLLTLSTSAQENQNLHIQNKLKDGSFVVYKTMTKGRRSVFEKATKPWPVQFFEGESGIEKILVKRVGLIDEFYEADLPTFPGYFQNSGSGINLTALDGKLFYYNYSSKSGAEIKYVLTSGASPGNFAEEKSTLESYRKAIKVLQTSARSERKEARAEEARVIAAKNSLEGKNIKSILIKLVDEPSEFGLLSVFQVGFEVTLTDGNVLKTKNLGGLTPYTDFDYRATSGEFTGGDFKVHGNADKIEEDKMTLSVWSKFDPSVKGQFETTLNYKNDLFYNFQGQWGNHGRRVVGYSDYGTSGSAGHSISVTANRRQANDETVIDISIYDLQTSRSYQCTLHPDHTLHIDVSGGNGGNGLNGDRTTSGNGANGGDGGDGGTISVSGTASQILKIDAKTSGGAGGKGGSAKTLAHRSGTSGSNGSNGRLTRN